MTETLRKFALDIGVFLLQLLLGIGVVVYALWANEYRFVFVGVVLGLGAWLALHPFISAYVRKDERIVKSHDILDERGTLVSLKASGIAFKSTLVVLEYLFFITLLWEIPVRSAYLLGLVFVVTGFGYIAAWVY